MRFVSQRKGAKVVIADVLDGSESVAVVERKRGEAIVVRTDVRRSTRA
jgi:hypothetical protein